MRMFAVQCHESGTTRIFASSSAVKAVKTMAVLTHTHRTHEFDEAYFSAFEVQGLKHFKVLKGKARRIDPDKSRK